MEKWETAFFPPACMWPWPSWADTFWGFSGSSSKGQVPVGAISPGDYVSLEGFSSAKREFKHALQHILYSKKRIDTSGCLTPCSAQQKEWWGLNPGLRSLKKKKKKKIQKSSHSTLIVLIQSFTALHWAKGPHLRVCQDRHEMLMLQLKQYEYCSTALLLPIHWTILIQWKSSYIWGNNEVG